MSFTSSPTFRGIFVLNARELRRHPRTSETNPGNFLETPVKRACPQIGFPGRARRIWREITAGNLPESRADPTQRTPEKYTTWPNTNTSAATADSSVLDIDASRGVIPWNLPAPLGTCSGAWDVVRCDVSDCCSDNRLHFSRREAAF